MHQRANKMMKKDIWDHFERNFEKVGVWGHPEVGTLGNPISLQDETLGGCIPGIRINLEGKQPQHKTADQLQVLKEALKLDVDSGTGQKEIKILSGGT